MTLSLWYSGFNNLGGEEPQVIHIDVFGGSILTFDGIKAL